MGLFSCLYTCMEYLFCVEMYCYIMWRCSIFIYGLLDESVRSVICRNSTFYVGVQLIPHLILCKVFFYLHFYRSVRCAFVCMCTVGVVLLE